MLHLILPSSRVAILVRVVEDPFAFTLSTLEVPIIAPLAVCIRQLSDAMLKIPLKPTGINITISVGVSAFAVPSLRNIKKMASLKLHHRKIRHHSGLRQGTLRYPSP